MQIIVDKYEIMGCFQGLGCGRGRVGVPAVTGGGQAALQRLINIDATPDDYRAEALSKSLNPRLLVEFVDGSKTAPSFT